MDPKMNYYWVSFSGGMSVQAVDRETAIDAAAECICDDPGTFLVFDTEMDGE
ncbi:hypothetical protein CHEID_02275 [Corynebacterium heidelbergense]|nr:hypothetical protein CHEID_02275 [Corynebacterium heidelbergense]